MLLLVLPHCSLDDWFNCREINKECSRAVSSSGYWLRQRDHLVALLRSRELQKWLPTRWTDLPLYTQVAQLTYRFCDPTRDGHELLRFFYKTSNGCFRYLVHTTLGYQFQYVHPMKMKALAHLDKVKRIHYNAVDNTVVFLIERDGFIHLVRGPLRAGGFLSSMSVADFMAPHLSWLDQRGFAVTRAITRAVAPLELPAP